MKATCIVLFFLAALQFFSGAEAGVQNVKGPLIGPWLAKHKAHVAKKASERLGKQVNVSQAIMGGGDYGHPYYVALLGDNWACGGTLISMEYVLTSAYCLAICAGESDFSIYLGYYKKESLSSYVKSDITFDDWYSHAEYDAGTDMHNIGIITIPDVVTRTETLYPIDIFVGDTSTFVGKTITISGIGSLSATEILLSEKLMNTELIVNEVSYCTSFPEYSSMTDDSHICAASNNQDNAGACMYDDGGPVLMWDSVKKDNWLIGIIGFQVNICPIAMEYPTRLTKLNTENLCFIQYETDLPLGVTCGPVSPCEEKRKKKSMAKNKKLSRPAKYHHKKAIPNKKW